MLCVFNIWDVQQRDLSGQHGKTQSAVARVCVSGFSGCFTMMMSCACCRSNDINEVLLCMLICDRCKKTAPGAGSCLTGGTRCS